jgi:hypothetical protein
MRRGWWSAKRVAGLCIAAQFLALVRTLGEVFRIKQFSPGRYTLATIEPFVGAAWFTAMLVAVAVAAFALGRYRAAVGIAVANIVALFVYKLAFM